MNIIIEGPDGAGKTYLANQLAELLGMTIQHFGAPADNIEAAQQYDMYYDYVQNNMFWNTIIDRAWYSDMVYGPIFRGKQHISVNMMLHLERLIDDCVIIYCTGTPKLMWKAAQERGENYVTTYEQYKAICRAYDKLFITHKHILPIHKRFATWLEH